MHGRIGSGTTTPARSYTGSNNESKRTTSLPTMAIGLDSSALRESPIVAEGGILTNFENYAYYLEGGPVRRIGEHLRASAAVGGELWPGENLGAGVRTSVTLEYASRFRREGNTTETGYDSHDRTTSYMWQSGVFGIGGFVDAGHRWIRNEPNYTYVIFGLSFRLPLLLGYGDVSGQH